MPDVRGEIGLIHAAGVWGRIRYWSGGNPSPWTLEAASCAGLGVYGDWKDPRTQRTDEVVIGVHPWQPVGGLTPRICRTSRAMTRTVPFSTFPEG